MLWLGTVLHVMPSTCRHARSHTMSYTCTNMRCDARRRRWSQTCAPQMPHTRTPKLPRTMMSTLPFRHAQKLSRLNINTCTRTSTQMVQLRMPQTPHHATHLPVAQLNALMPLKMQQVPSARTQRRTWPLRTPESDVANLGEWHPPRGLTVPTTACGPLWPGRRPLRRSRSGGGNY